MTPVENIYARISAIIEDHTYCKLPDEDIEFLFKNFLETAIIYFKELNVKHKPIIVENDFGELLIQKTKNVQGEDDGLDLEEEVILAHGMILSWHKSKILRDKFLKQNLNTGDFNRLSNATMLANNLTLMDMLDKEFVKLRRRYRNRDWNGDGL
jgi:hypothetical protein